MKLEKGGITAAVFVGSLVILLAAAYIFSGFRPGTQTLIAVVYFAIWITLLTFLWFSVISPAIAELRKRKKTAAPVQAEPDLPKPSPRAHLPLRERIQQYVAERRREDGLPAPEPLRPSRPAGTTAAATARAAAPAAAAGTAVAAGAADEGELPLPDDFDSGLGEGEGLPGLEGGDELPGLDEEPGAGEELPGLPDLDEDMSFDEAGVEDGGVSDDLSGDLSGGDFDDEISFDAGEAVSEPVADDGGGGGLPDFDGDLDADMSESDLSGDDDFDSFSADDSGDDLMVEPAPAEETEEMPPEPSGEDDGGGLPDFDGDLDADMSESDLSGDEDFGDIEFEDLEPDEI